MDSDMLGSVIQTSISQFTSLPVPSTDCTGKTVLVTGGNVGLGLETARHFARLNAARIIIACRDTEKAQTAKADIEASTGRSGLVEVWSVDLESFESVKSFCDKAAELDRLDIVVENAGIAPYKCRIVAGFESSITVNVISTALMALLLLPTLRRTSTKFNVQPHIVIVSSDAHRFVTYKALEQGPVFFDHLRTDKNFNERYNLSKLLEVYFARELVQAMKVSGQPRVVINTVNPGLCQSQLFRSLPWPLTWVAVVALFLFARSCEHGSRNFVVAALNDEAHGAYISDCKVTEPSVKVTGEVGVKKQKQVYNELLSILEEIQPGISKNI